MSQHIDHERCEEADRDLIYAEPLEEYSVGECYSPT